MLSDKIYDLCRPVLDDDSLGEEEKTDKLEEILSSEPASLKGKALEDAVLGALWQWKSATDKTSSPPPVRGGAVIRKSSPASWIQQRQGTPASSTSATGSPGPPFAAPARGPLARTQSSNASPFTSPRPSPRLPVATPSIPHGSPRLSAYQPSMVDSSPMTDKYGDYGSDTVDWLVNNDDDVSSNTSFGDSGFGSSGADFFALPYTTDMSPYDMLRSILQNDSTDDELEQILEANGYDLGQTVNSIMFTPEAISNLQPEPQNRTYLVGKSMSPSSRPITPAGQQKSPIVCRYWLASGHCARADCRFAHEVQNHVCKYWLQGNCIAGNACLFSHDPAMLMQQLSLSNAGTHTPQQFAPNFQVQDYDSFPTLQPTSSNPHDESVYPIDQNAMAMALQQQQAGLYPNFVPTGPRNNNSRPGSRPASRHGSRAPTPSQPNFQDDEAFPTLGTAAANKPGKRHHGKRGGHGHSNRDVTLNASAVQAGNMADVVRMYTPSPQPNTSTTNSNSRDALRRGLKNNRSFTSTSSTTRENSAQSLSIPPPENIPWLQTGSAANAAYLKARAEAFKHGGLRNKFLQSAAQAWNRNDARGAKALSLRGQNENLRMRELHREAARCLYEGRNKGLGQGGEGAEVYVDLHGLHPEEAVGYLSDCLKEQAMSGKPVYAICGTGHHSKNGKDKVGKAIRTFLNEWRYAFREFSVPGDRNNVGGILGIDPNSFDRTLQLSRSEDGGDSGVGLDEAGRMGDTKVVVVREDPRKAVEVGVTSAEVGA